jgi:GTPase SAR1 family protein
MLNNYSQLKSNIVECIHSMSTLEGLSCACEELKEKLEENVFNLVVLGQFKRGKTSFINALLGEELLPTAVVPLTSIVTIIRYGDPLRVNVHFNDGRVEQIVPEKLVDYVTEKGNAKNEKDVKEVVIEYPSPWLKDGVHLIDTPGVGSVYQHNTDVAYRYLPNSDAALFLLSVDQPFSSASSAFSKT